MSRYKSYPAYKDSGSEWLGHVPQHWNVSLLKYFARLDGGAGFPDNEQGIEDAPIPFFKVADLATGMTTSDNYITVETAIRLRAKIFPEGTIAFAKVGAALLLNRRVLMKVSGCVDNNMMVALPRGVRADWLLYLLSIFDMGWLVNPGAVPSVNQEQVGNIKLPVPATNEQASIVAHLDRETTRIDALVEKKTRFIELLSEKRQAFITHAVTKGLDPNVPMKNSGVDWLGEVPEHWTVLSFQRRVYIAEGQVNPEEQPYSDMTLIAPNHVESGTGRLLYTETAAEQMAESGKYLCREGDVIYSKIRPALRKACIAPADCLCSADMYPLRGDEYLLNSYLLWFLLSEPFSAFAVLEADRVAMPKINRESLNALKLALPPVEEQEHISRVLTRATTRIDALVEKTKRSIELLKEHRSALITAAVTGQIDLRATVAAESQTDLRETA